MSKYKKLTALILVISLVIPAFALPAAESICFAAQNAVPWQVRFFYKDRSCTLAVGEQCDIDYQYKPGDADTSLITWTTSDKKVAVVKDGHITAVGTGKAEITAKVPNGTTAQCRVTVKQAPSRIRFFRTELILGVYEKYEMKPIVPEGAWVSSLECSVSDPEVVSVETSNGICRVQAKKCGTAKLTVKTVNGKTASCTVKVLNAPSWVQIKPKQLTIGVGEKMKLTADYGKDCACNGLEFYVNGKADRQIVEIIKSGRQCEFAGKKPGNARILVKTFNGKSDFCEITVKAEPLEVGFEENDISVITGETGKVTPVLPMDTAAYSKTFTSDNAGVVKITDKENGTFKALKAGTANVTVTLYNGVKASCRIRVNEKTENASSKPEQQEKENTPSKPEQQEKEDTPSKPEQQEKEETPSKEEIRQLIYDRDRIEVYYLGEEKGEDGLPQLKLYIVNNSKENVDLQVRNETVNGMPVDARFSCNVKPGREKEEYIRYEKESFGRGRINSDKFNEASFRLVIFNHDTFGNIRKSDTIRLGVKADAGIMPAADSGLNAAQKGFNNIAAFVRNTGTVNKDGNKTITGFERIGESEVKTSIVCNEAENKLYLINHIDTKNGSFSDSALVRIEFSYRDLNKVNVTVLDAYDPLKKTKFFNCACFRSEAAVKTSAIASGRKINFKVSDRAGYSAEDAGELSNSLLKVSLETYKRFLKRNGHNIEILLS